VLRKHGVKKGDRVTIYLPMIPEAAYAMLACARIGAVHSVVSRAFRRTACATAFWIAIQALSLRQTKAFGADARSR
jgi:acyl-coenzyme A synthetase/AMP-(fatty) acid ligase